MTQRKRRLHNEIGLFVQKVGRKKRNGLDPNDRSYDRKIEALVSRMDPEELAAILDGETNPSAPLEPEDPEERSRDPLGLGYPSPPCPK